ncbi:hypothetical protein [Namhaeicola litoreus]|uniref:DUF1826 domain-containing protein n=1 Tax=Namhaeicola litoreus TaxID=1052145 RepID=A0ABW3Y5C9_9FLAO
MENISHTENQIQYVTNFQDFVSASFHGKINAICWNRKLAGDFSEIVRLLASNENIAEIQPNDLLKLKLSDQGQLAREILLEDLKTLKDLGACPTLNLIEYYDRDDGNPLFPTDVYSFHVDRSPIPVDTFLCTYCGESSEILPNAQARQKILVPEIRDELKKIYQVAEEDFESFLSENFFDLHYLAKPEAKPIKLGLGHLYRLAIDHPKSKVLPCIHRAPKEKSGQKRLLLIC